MPDWTAVGFSKGGCCQAGAAGPCGAGSPPAQGLLCCMRIITPLGEKLGWGVGMTKRGEGADLGEVLEAAAAAAAGGGQWEGQSGGRRRWRRPGGCNWGNEGAAAMCCLNGPLNAVSRVIHATTCPSPLTVHGQAAGGCSGRRLCWAGERRPARHQAPGRSGDCGGGRRLPCR